MLLLNRIFGFDGMLKAQPITEAVMMTVSLVLLNRFITKEESDVASSDGSKEL